MSEWALRSEALTFGYGREPVIDGATFSLRRGDFAAIVGPNGGGKTTLVRLALGLLTPQSGRIEVLGESPVTARARVGYMPQHALNDPSFPVTALEVVLMGRLGRSPGLGPHRRRDVEIALSRLEDVNLAGAAKTRMSELSGGQRQRVLIARALASEAELLLMDEPLANVDQLQEARFFETVRGLDSSMTVVIVSHDLAFVSQSVDTVICVHGRVHAHPTVELDGSLIREMYGQEISLVRHDCHVDHHPSPELGAGS